jgi:hypothetical protein
MKVSKEKSFLLPNEYTRQGGFVLTLFAMSYKHMNVPSTSAPVRVGAPEQLPQAGVNIGSRKVLELSVSPLATYFALAYSPFRNFATAFDAQLRANDGPKSLVS